MAASENAPKNIFGILENFLIKVASLDIFEVLIFNYKLKSEFVNGLTCNFIPIIDELMREVQDLLNDCKNKPGLEDGKTTDLYLFPSLEDNYGTANVPECKKADKSNSNLGEHCVDLISNSVLREISLFSQKCIIEDNIEVDTTDSLWNSDSKSCDALPNQIHLPEISNHTTKSDTCNSIHCLSCHRLLNSDEYNLPSQACKYCKEKPSKNSCQSEDGFSDKINTTKLGQDFAMDFRHSTEIRSLIEDALHLPNADHTKCNIKPDYKNANNHCAIMEEPESDLIHGGDESHSKNRVIMNLNARLIPKELLMDESNYNHTRELSDESKKEIESANNVPDKVEAVAGKDCSKVIRNRKRTIEVDDDRHVSEKTREALCNVNDTEEIHPRGKSSESALGNTVIVNSVQISNNEESGEDHLIVKSAKKKNLQKDGGEMFGNETAGNADGETEMKENQDTRDAKMANADSRISDEIKCLGSSVTPFICCGDCLFVYKDWESYDKHVCNSSSANKESRTGSEEDVDDVVSRSPNNEKEKEEDDSRNTVEDVVSVEGKSSDGLDEKDKMALEEIVRIVNNSKGIDGSNLKSNEERKSVITNYETLMGIHRFVCSICLEEYRSVNRMMYHLPRCVPGPYKCELCPLEYVSRRELNFHKKKNHQDAQSFICDECGVKFKFRTSLQKHKVNRHERWLENEVYSCPQCTQTFPKKIYLTNHCIKVHCLERKFLCQICGKKFLNQNSLNSHLNYHAEEAKNRFSCSQCSKTFIRKEKLQYHLRIHTGERPFECKSCGKTFISKAKLTEHLWCHGGKKRFSCPVCPKKYAGRWDLKVHVRKMHGKSLSSVEGQLIEISSEATPEQTTTTHGDKKELATTIIGSDFCTTQVLLVGDIENRSINNDSDDLVMQLSAVPSLEQNIPSESFATLTDELDHALPQANVQPTQYIQLNSPSPAPSMPIHIQVSSAGFDASSQPSILFTSGLYLS